MTPASTSNRHIIVRKKKTDVAKFWNMRKPIRQKMSSPIELAWFIMAPDFVLVDFTISKDSIKSANNKSKSEARNCHFTPDNMGRLKSVKSSEPCMLGKVGSLPVFAVIAITI